MSRRLLLISNSTAHGEGYLDHCIDEMLDFLGDRKRLGFVPFALHDREAYGAHARSRFARAGLEAVVLTADASGVGRLAELPAVFVGGGNTFRLLDALARSGMLALLRRRTADDLAYMGASAGANVAAPTIKTTNDLPIVEPPSFAAIGAVPFQINPHYLDPPPASTHMGETREQRLAEYLEENAAPVVGLREGAWIRVEDGDARLGGRAGARIFRRGGEPEERLPGDSLSDLLAAR